MKYNYSNIGDSTGIGHIVIPNNVDRDNFIQTCFNTSTVSILIDNGAGIFNQCPIDDNILQRIDFPLQKNEIGSDVAYMMLKTYAQPIIVAKLPKLSETTGLDRYSFKIGKGDVKVSGNDDGKVLNIIVDNPEKGEINLVTKSNNSVINIKSQGETKITSKNDINIKSNDTIILNSRNTGQETDSKITIENGKITLFTGSNKMVLGDELKTTIENILNSITQLTVPTALGQSGVPLNVIDFQNIKATLQSILSNKSYLD